MKTSIQIKSKIRIINTKQKDENEKLIFIHFHVFFQNNVGCFNTMIKTG